MSLEDYLASWADGDVGRHKVVGAVLGMAAGSRTISELLARGALAGAMGATIGNRGPGNDQKELDIIANDAILAALRGAQVAAVVSEEMDEPAVLDAAAPLLVGVDPIDGSSNIDSNVSIGTIFTVLPADGGAIGAGGFLQPGTAQLAAGSFVYGPQTTLALTVGAGTQVFTLDRGAGAFLMTAEEVQIPLTTTEFAINMSNYRHWDDAVRIYIDDLLRGTEGPRGQQFNMRWTASPVADIQRILTRGGIYLYPGDHREGFGEGRLRLIYEANPLGFLVEQASGAAFTDSQRIMEVPPRSLHQRVPVIMGSRDEVNFVVRLHAERFPGGEYSPLFARRGLFRI